jgi:heme A synthase
VAESALLLTFEMALGVATLVLGLPPALSIMHRVGGVVLLAVAFTLAPSRSPRLLPKSMIPKSGHRFSEKIMLQQ